MKTEKREKGQALILIIFGMIVLIGLTGLAVDGGMAYSDRRNAQNAADAAALAAALANARQRDVNSAAFSSAFNNGYNNDGSHNVVMILVADSPAGVCPNDAPGKDITVQITSHIRTYFAPVIGITQTTNTVSATTRVCGTYIAPLFGGNAIVALAPHGTDFSGIGNPNWNVQGGGIFVNSDSSSAAICGGSATVNAPSVTAVGSANMGCGGTIGSITNGFSPAYTWDSYKNKLPQPPTCTGTATWDGTLSIWRPDSNAAKAATGSNASFSGGSNFAPGLYCITDGDIGPYHNYITGSGVTFYIKSPNFNIKFNGQGGLIATAPTSGPYQGVVMYLKPQTDGNNNLIQTQQLDLRGNGSAGVVGSIIAPSANVTMYGNSGTAGDNTQVIAYTVTSGGGANITIKYNAQDNFQTAADITATFLK